jgi:hypothetical protein
VIGVARIALWRAKASLPEPPATCICEGSGCNCERGALVLARAVLVFASGVLVFARGVLVFARGGLVCAPPPFPSGFSPPGHSVAGSQSAHRGRRKPAYSDSFPSVFRPQDHSGCGKPVSETGFRPQGPRETSLFRFVFVWFPPTGPQQLQETSFQNWFPPTRAAGNQLIPLRFHLFSADRATAAAGNQFPKLVSAHRGRGKPVYSALCGGVHVFARGCMYLRGVCLYLLGLTRPPKCYIFNKNLIGNH